MFEAGGDVHVAWLLQVSDSIDTCSLLNQFKILAELSITHLSSVVFFQ